MKLNIVMISRAGSQKNIWDVCSESVESLIHLPALRAAFQSAQAPLAHPLPQLSFWSELILIKVAAKPEERAQVIAIADIFRAKIVDVGEESMMIELTGNESKLDACTKLLEKFTILELARTGITGLSRGSAQRLHYLPTMKKQLYYSCNHPCILPIQRFRCKHPKYFFGCLHD